MLFVIEWKRKKENNRVYVVSTYRVSVKVEYARSIDICMFNMEKCPSGLRSSPGKRV